MYCILRLDVVSLVVVVYASCPLGGGCGHCAVLLHNSLEARDGVTCVLLEPLVDIRVPL